MFLILFTALFESAHGSQNARLLTEEVKISACVNMHASIYSLYIKPVRLNVAMELLEKKNEEEVYSWKKEKCFDFIFFLNFYDYYLHLKCTQSVHLFTFRYIKIEFERLKWYILVN